MRINSRRSVKQQGVSLLEFVLGLVILAVVLAGVSLFSLGQPQRLDPVFQFRAVSLAEALAEQVFSARYDANNNPSLQQRCGLADLDGNFIACANHAYDPTELDTDGTVMGIALEKFTAVDDFQFWCEPDENGVPEGINGQALANELGLPSPELYSRFSITTCVEAPVVLSPPYDEADPHLFVKKVSINISIEHSGTLSFLLHRYNIR